MKRKLLKFLAVFFVFCAFIVSYFHTDLMLYFGKAESGAQAPWFPAPKSEPGRHNVAVVSTRQIIPGDGLPTAAVVMKSNNNLATIRHDGRIWLAWRTATTHFPSPDATMQVMSSEDERTWRMETSVTMGTDLREPQFLSLHGELFLYMTVLGDSAWSFSPKDVVALQRKPDGSWTVPAAIGLPRHVMWRIQTIAGRAYMTAYDKGESLYALTGGPSLEVKLLTTDDGWFWRSADPAHATIHAGGGSETDFAIGNEGHLFGIMRNEFGEAGRYGSLICTAHSSAIAEWRCLADKKKYDSPRVFAYDGEVYMVARRNITKSGDFERDVLFKGIRNQLSYISQGKRCSLWRFADDGTRIAFMLDLPSKGDTCFASIIPGEVPGEFIVYDYSSPLEGPDQAWSVGQRNPSVILRHVLQFVKR
jgi:hypothetical protein